MIFAATFVFSLIICIRAIDVTELKSECSIKNFFKSPDTTFEVGLNKFVTAGHARVINGADLKEELGDELEMNPLYIRGVYFGKFAELDRNVGTELAKLVRCYKLSKLLQLVQTIDNTDLFDQMPATTVKIPEGKLVGFNLHTADDIPNPLGGNVRLLVGCTGVYYSNAEQNYVMKIQMNGQTIREVSSNLKQACRAYDSRKVWADRKFNLDKFLNARKFPEAVGCEDDVCDRISELEALWDRRTRPAKRRRAPAPETNDDSDS